MAIHAPVFVLMYVFIFLRHIPKSRISELYANLCLENEYFSFPKCSPTVTKFHLLLVVLWLCIGMKLYIIEIFSRWGLTM